MTPDRYVPSLLTGVPPRNGSLPMLSPKYSGFDLLDVPMTTSPMLIDRYFARFSHERWRIVNALPPACTVAVAGPQKTRAVAPPYFVTPALHPAEAAPPVPAQAIVAAAAATTTTNPSVLIMRR